MNSMNILFALAFALLLTHEMDAIRNQEWKMFIGLKELPEETAYRIFLLLHLPLYLIILVLLTTDLVGIGMIIVDVFLIFHTILHYFFRHHPENQLTNRLSKGIINAAGVAALLHFVIAAMW